jgi:hypothetical protein
MKAPNGHYSRWGASYEIDDAAETTAYCFSSFLAPFCVVSHSEMVFIS